MRGIQDGQQLVGSASPPQEAALLLSDAPQPERSPEPRRQLAVVAAPLMLAALAAAAAAALLLSRGGPARQRTAGTVALNFTEHLFTSAAVRNESFRRFVGLAEARRRALPIDPPPPAVASVGARELGEPAEATGKVDEKKISDSQCVVDVVNVVTLLGMGIEFLWQATGSTFLRCPDRTKGCAVAVSYVITCFSWVAESLSSAVSSCAGKPNQQAACAADVTGMIATLGGFAASGSSVGTSCGWASMSRLDKLNALLEWRRGGAAPSISRPARDLDSFDRLMSEEQRRKEQNWAYAQCSFDVALAASMLMQAGIRIAAATETCADPTFCAVDMLTIIGALSWAANSLSMAASDCCADDDSADALCAGDIANFVANTGLLTAFAMSSSADCQAKAEEQPESPFATA